MVPARDEQDTIRALLDSLLEQTWPAAEIIVVDAGSVDRTAQIVRDYGRAHAVRLLTQGPAFPGTARNAGVDVAASEHIAFTDAGIQVDREWLERLCRPLFSNHDSAAPPGVVFGSYEPFTNSFFAQCAATAYVPARSTQEGKEIRGPFVASCLMRKDLFHAAGGFPPYRASEDLMFFDKIRDRRWTVAYAPEAIARWEMAAGWGGHFPPLPAVLLSQPDCRPGTVLAPRARALVCAGGAFGYSRLRPPSCMVGGPYRGAGARIALTIWRKRKENWGSPLNPLRWMCVGLILILLDAAAFAGAVWWAADKIRGRLPVSLPDSGGSVQGTPA